MDDDNSSIDAGELMGGAYEMTSEPMSSEAQTYIGGESSDSEDQLQYTLTGGSGFLSNEESERVAKKKRAQLAVKAFVDENE